MAMVLSETRPGRITDLVLGAMVLFAAIDYLGVIDITTTSVYVFFLITPLGFLRLYLDYRCEKQPSE
jgi:hypothetical protein